MKYAALITCLFCVSVHAGQYYMDTETNAVWSTSSTYYSESDADLEPLAVGQVRVPITAQQYADMRNEAGYLANAPAIIAAYQAQRIAALAGTLDPGGVAFSNRVTQIAALGAQAGLTMPFEIEQLSDALQAKIEQLVDAGDTASLKLAIRINARASKLDSWWTAAQKRGITQQDIYAVGQYMQGGGQ